MYWSPLALSISMQCSIVLSGRCAKKAGVGEEGGGKLQL